MWVLEFVAIAAIPVGFGAFMGWVNDKIALWIDARRPIPPMPEPYEPEEV
jgi:hypothetical protein